jgi:hypothetical protein
MWFPFLTSLPVGINFCPTPVPAEISIRCTNFYMDLSSKRLRTDHVRWSAIKCQWILLLKIIHWEFSLNRDVRWCFRTNNALAYHYFILWCDVMISIPFGGIWSLHLRSKKLCSCKMLVLPTKLHGVTPEICSLLSILKCFSPKLRKLTNYYYKDNVNTFRFIWIKKVLTTEQCGNLSNFKASQINAYPGPKLCTL